MGPRPSRPLWTRLTRPTILGASLVLAGCAWPFMPETVLRPEMFAPAQAGGLKVSLTLDGADRERLAPW